MSLPAGHCRLVRKARTGHRCHVLWGPALVCKRGQTRSPAVLPPPPALLTLSAGSSSLTIHDRDLANSLVRQGMENLLGSGTGSSAEPSMYSERRGRSRSPVLRGVPHRQQTQHEALEDARILEERSVRPRYYDRGDDTWIPSLGFFCRLKFPSSAIRAPVLDGMQWSHLLVMEQTCLSARKYGGTETATRPTCVLEWLYMRQHAHIKAAGGSGVYDSTFSQYFDLVRGADGRWLARSSRTVFVGPAVFWSCWNR